MLRTSIAVSFSINGGLSAETSPIKWEKPQFFLRFSDCIAQSCGGELEVALISLRRTRTMELCCGVHRCLVRSAQKKRPGESKITGAYLGHGAMSRGRA